MKNTEIRNELRVPLTLAVFARSHPFLHGVTEEDLVRDPIQERVPCGHHSERERYLHFALSVANEGEKFSLPSDPLVRERRGPPGLEAHAASTTLHRTSKRNNTG